MSPHHTLIVLHSVSLQLPAAHTSSHVYPLHVPDPYFRSSHSTLSCVHRRSSQPLNLSTDTFNVEALWRGFRSPDDLPSACSRSYRSR